MLKSTYLGGIIVGLAILLATCGGLPAGESQVPAEVEMPASVENAETEAMSVEVEEPLAEEVVVPEEVADNATTDEMVNQNEKAGPAEIDADAEVATTEEEVVSEGMADVETATEVEPMLEDETVSVEEAEMSEEVADHEQSATSTEVIADEQEMMSEEAVETAQGPTEEQMQLLEGLAVLGTPSELNNEVWLNSEPLKLADLRGKVAIVEFWTFG